MTLQEACEQGRDIALKNKRTSLYIRHNESKGYYPSIMPGRDTVYKFVLKWELEEYNETAKE